MFEPNYRITNNVLTYISRIEQAKALIENSPLVPAWEKQFKNEAMERTVHYGTKIEGNDLTREQAHKILISETDNSQRASLDSGIVARDRDIQELINYRNVVVWIDRQERNYSQELLSEKTFRDLHKVTMKKLIEDRYIGQFRDKQVIIKSVADGSVVFRPPHFLEVPFLIQDFFDWLNYPPTMNIHPIIRAAISHYQLVFIHPFIEGNGRTARAMATLIAYVSNYDFKKFFSLEEYFDRDVEVYYRALLSVQKSQDSDLTFWLEYFCYGLALEIDKIKQKVLRLSQDLKLKQQLGQQVALSERQIILLEILQQQGEITSEEAQQAVPNVSVDTLLRDIKDLIHKGIIAKKGVTKGVRYILKES
jgi:Fic family protein